MNRRVLDHFLAHLGFDREAPSLDHLHRIVREHQVRVPAETSTKLLDSEPDAVEHPNRDSASD